MRAGTGHEGRPWKALIELCRGTLRGHVETIARYSAVMEDDEGGDIGGGDGCSDSSMAGVLLYVWSLGT